MIFTFKLFRNIHISQISFFSSEIKARCRRVIIKHVRVKIPFVSEIYTSRKIRTNGSRIIDYWLIYSCPWVNDDDDDAALATAVGRFGLCRPQHASRCYIICRAIVGREPRPGGRCRAMPLFVWFRQRAAVNSSCTFMSDAKEDSAEKRLKIVLVGDSGAGKVSFSLSRPRSKARAKVVDPVVSILAKDSYLH